MVLAGAGVGLLLGPVSTDAINRAPNTSYGEATGITQTVRNYAAAFGLAVLGTVLTTQNRSNVEEKLGALGEPTAEADKIAHAMTSSGGGSKDAIAGHVSGEKADEIFAALQGAFASSTSTVLYIMGGVMVACFLFSQFGMVGGKMKEIIADEGEEPEAAAPPPESS